MTSIAAALFALALQDPSAFMPRERDVALMGWAGAPPYWSTMKEPWPERANLLCFRTGTFGFALDTKKIRLLHAGPLEAPPPSVETLVGAFDPVLALPPGTMNLTLKAGGRIYTCRGRKPAPKDRFFYPVQFVESGRLFHRVRIEGLLFEDSKGNRFQGDAAIEISVWPDRAALELQAPKAEPFVEALGRKGTNRAIFFGADDHAKVSIRKSSGDVPARAAWDPVLGCARIELDGLPWSNAKGTYYPEEHLDRVDRTGIELVNDADRERVVRLMFVQQRHLKITGLTPMLLEADGRPTGLPVQLSKNWHIRKDKGRLVHDGVWYHGFALVRLPPRARRTLVHAVAYARWGGAPAASHAQLCLIGWAHNQLWHEAALGSFGETICFEPGRVQRRCFITDVRPLMVVHEPGAKKWAWTRNVGGGDFLVYFDAEGRYVPFAGTVAYVRSHGPNVTEAHYAERSADGRLSARMAVSLTRTDDYPRVFQRIRYDVLARTPFRRLALYQLGSDFYNGNRFGKAAVGNASGLVEEWEPRPTRAGYARQGVRCPGRHPWISVHATKEPGGKGVGGAARGLIVRSWRAKLGGKDVPEPFAATYAREHGRKNLRTHVELVPPPGLHELLPGDFVEAELELVILPLARKDYYGPNLPFARALEAHADTWQMVHREARANDLKVSAGRGTVRRSYPVVVAADPLRGAALEVTGGAGWVPFTFEGLSKPDGWRLMRRTGGKSREVGRGWQADYDPRRRTWSLSTTVPLEDAPGPALLEFRLGE